MSVVLVDDHILLQLLLGNEPTELRNTEAAIATTGLWYHRLCRALGHEGVVGSLSRQLGGLPKSTTNAVIASVTELPEDLEVVSLRLLGWPMAQLVKEGARINLLSLEALAAARHLAAEIWMADANINVPLQKACEHARVSTRIVRV